MTTSRLYLFYLEKSEMDEISCELFTEMASRYRRNDSSSKTLHLCTRRLKKRGEHLKKWRYVFLNLRKNYYIHEYMLYKILCIKFYVFVGNPKNLGHPITPIILKKTPIQLIKCEFINRISCYIPYKDMSLVCNLKTIQCIHFFHNFHHL